MVDLLSFLVKFLPRAFGAADDEGLRYILWGSIILVIIIVAIIAVVVVRSLRNINEKNKKYTHSD